MRPDADVDVESEAELLARCLAGKAEAWDSLFDRHYDPAARFIFQLAPDFTREDVEEVCQEVFLTVIKSLPSFLGNSRFQTWLFRIAANKARDYRQRIRAAKRGGGVVTVSLHQDPDSDLPPLDPASPQPSPDLALLKAESISLIGEAMTELGGPCQEIIELRYFADLSYEEIAAALELNPKTVSSRLSKCLDKLEILARRRLGRLEQTTGDPVQRLPTTQNPGGPPAPTKTRETQTRSSV
jgi:RNA polymerase sigma-70 factor (ECF subfamily)